MGENVPTPPNQPTPPDKKEMTPDGPVKRIGDYLVGQAQSAFTDCINRMVTDGFIDYDEYTALIEKGLACMKDLRANIPEAVALRPYSRSGYSYDDLFLWSADPTLAAKAGRMLSAANARRLQSAWDEISAILEAAGLMDTDESDEADTADSDGKAAPQPDAEPGEDPSLTLQALEQMRAELTDLRAKHK